MSDTLTFDDVVIPDTIPPVSDVDYPCVVCGKESGPYGGRGRKPKYCPEHRKTSGASRGTRVTGTNDTLARQATEALCQLNGFMALGAMMTGLVNTASAISNAEDGFREQCYSALLTDPALCRTILKAGVKSGKISLLIAYGMFIASVAPVAALELKAKKDERDARKLAEELAAA